MEKAIEPEPKEQDNSEKVLTVLNALKNIFENDLIDFESIKDQLPEMTEEELQNELDKLYYAGDIDQPRPNKYKII